ncbi:universal stress protein [Halorubrum sp. SD626R]|uniref:universal stress protein n=1 Tax=Halorubrum sp. SD626R TaxID=1419722 RepID=UPI0010F96D73|nr:universal stress protein [Halorubrum sp. SD626R]TKX79025.1 universal stress protein [Halorubrum sp. SD626R]
MSIDTVVLAVGTEGEAQTAQLAKEAIAVAEPASAEVVLVHVFDGSEFERIRAKLGVDGGGEGSIPDAVAERHTTTRALGDALSAAGVRYSVRGAVGDLADEVTEAATDVGEDRGVVGGRRRSPTGKAVFGSVAQEVMLAAPCPVTFVRDVTA